MTALPNFPRLKSLLEGQDASFALEAIKSSDDLELSEDQTGVKRKVALPEDIDLEALTVFVVRFQC